MLDTPISHIMQHLGNRIIGQKEVLRQLRAALTLAAAGVGDPDKPLCIMYFAGPTGVGKSETVVALAEAIHGNAESLCRVDCNKLVESHSIASLTGAPPGYVGFAENASMLNRKAIIGQPGRPGILVFEEFEKAHPNIWNALLGVFDKAKMGMNTGMFTIDFSNTIIIMTSNIGAEELKKEVLDSRIGFGAGAATAVEAKLNLSSERAKAIVKKNMEKTFPPEFIGRIDETVVFRWLNPEEGLQVTENLAEQFVERLRRRGIPLLIKPEAVAFVAEQGFDPRYGARPIKAAFRKLVEYPVAEKITSVVDAGKSYIVSRQNDHLYVRCCVQKTPASVTVFVFPAMDDGQPPEKIFVQKKKGVVVNMIPCTLEVNGKKIELEFMQKEAEIFNSFRLLLSRKYGSSSPDELQQVIRLVTEAIVEAKIAMVQVKYLDDKTKEDLLAAASEVVWQESYYSEFKDKSAKILAPY